MTTTPSNATLPMTLGAPIGPNLRVTTSEEVEATLANSEVTFGGLAPEESTARWVHWLTQASPHEALVAAQYQPGGRFFLANVYLIERTDDQGRTWSCVTSSWWTAGLFLSKAQAHDFAVELARRETPSGGWDYSVSREIPARTHIPPQSG